MKFTVGYQMRQEDDFLTAIISRKQQISEVYFSWGNIPNGRNTAGTVQGLTLRQAMEKQSRDLKLLSSYGIPLHLLLNANCYGADSLSRRFLCQIGDTVEDLEELFGLSGVTTTSPVIAKFLKKNFAQLELRASVNMEIGTVQGMDYLAEHFDGYYIKRELNRNFSAIRPIKEWCDSNGKKLYFLANSGCLNFCSAHIFHDNLVAHENEIASRDNGAIFHGVCKEYLKREEKQISLVRDTNYVRPEDISLYEPYFRSAKLATRVSKHPAEILQAYTDGKYCGNLLELLEPDHSGDFYPKVLDNGSFPADFASHIGNCDKNCAVCGRCREIFLHAVQNLKDMKII